MPSQDTTETKEKIVFYIKQKGPSLPVHIAKEITQARFSPRHFYQNFFQKKK